MATQTDPLSLADLLGPSGSSLLLAANQPYVLRATAAPQAGFTGAQQFAMAQPNEGATRLSQGARDDPDRHLYGTPFVDPTMRYAYPPPMFATPAPAAAAAAPPQYAWGTNQYYPIPVAPSSSGYPQSAYDYAPTAAAAVAPSAAAAAGTSSSQPTGGSTSVASASSSPPSVGPTAAAGFTASPAPSRSHSTAVFKTQLANILSTIETCRKNIGATSASESTPPMQTYPLHHMATVPPSAWGSELAYPLGAPPRPLDYNSALFQARANAMAVAAAAAPAQT